MAKQEWTDSVGPVEIWMTTPVPTVHTGAGPGNNSWYAYRCEGAGVLGYGNTAAEAQVFWLKNVAEEAQSALRRLGVE